MPQRALPAAARSEDRASRSKTSLLLAQLFDARRVAASASTKASARAPRWAAAAAASLAAAAKPLASGCESSPARARFSPMRCAPAGSGADAPLPPPNTDARFARRGRRTSASSAKRERRRPSYCARREVVDASEAPLPCRCDKALRAAPVRTALADVAKVLNTSFASTAAAETAALNGWPALAISHTLYRTSYKYSRVTQIFFNIKIYH